MGQPASPTPSIAPPGFGRMRPQHSAGALPLPRPVVTVPKPRRRLQFAWRRVFRPTILARALAWSLAAALAVLLVAATGPALIGWHPVIVTGGSMGSALPVGSVAVMRTVDADEINVGDVIAMGNTGGANVLHRVIAIDEVDGVRTATMKGDANASADPRSADLHGEGSRLVYYVPYAGYALHYTSTPTGVVAIVAALLLALAWGKWRAGRRATRRG